MLKMNKGFSLIVSKKIKEHKKTISIDSDKSISIRSFLIGAISHNISEIKNVLESEDVLSTISCLKKLGVKIKKIKPKHYLVFGKGLGSLHAKKGLVLNCGNSGTLSRLLIGILSTTPNINVKITGDASLRKRNMSKLINLMSEFGAEFEKNKSKFPINFTSSDMPVGITYESGVSAQLKSAVMLAGLNSFGTTTVIEKKYKSRDHTENILLKSPKVLKVQKNIIQIFGKNYLNPLKLIVPGDPSAAAFFCAITLLTKNSYLKIKNVGLNPKRIGFYKLLKSYGGKIQFKNIKKTNNEIVGDVHVRSSKLKPIRARADFYPSTADEYPILFVIAAFISGVSTFKGISDLSNKESSRANEMKKILNQIGIKCKLNKNEMKIYGKNKIKKINKTIKLKKLNDHRLCMSMFCISAITGIKSYIKSFDTVFTSSPSFLKIIKSIGGKFEIKKIS